MNINIITQNLWLDIGILVALFLVLINLYFVIARKFQLVDVPNQRSSHSKSTIVGAGILFYLAVVVHFFIEADLTYFMIGTSLIALVGFLDDRMELSSALRVIIQLGATVLMLMQFDIIAYLEWWHWVGICILVVGTLNAYNFMDGINGITGIYSIVFLGTLLYMSVNAELSSLIIIEICAIAVFLFYNLRKKAVCFSGDVGSVTIAFVILFLLTDLMIRTERWEAFLLLAVYGVDSVLTIVHRLGKKENIFKAHRSHIYQLLVHNKGWSHLKVSTVYGLIQLFINVVFISLTDQNTNTVIAVTTAIFVILGSSSLIIRNKLNARSLHS